MSIKDKGTNLTYASTPNKTETLAEEEPPNYLDRLRTKELNTIVIKGQQIGLTSAGEAKGEHNPSRDCLCDTCKLYFRLTLGGTKE